jgi:hypothetical protein
VIFWKRREFKARKVILQKNEDSVRCLAPPVLSVRAVEILPHLSDQLRNGTRKFFMPFR